MTVGVTHEQRQRTNDYGLDYGGGNAKSEAFEAIQAAKNSDFDAATSHLKAADEALVTAHNVQTDLLTAEANGAHADVSLLLVHAQDHLMNAITFATWLAKWSRFINAWLQIRPLQMKRFKPLRDSQLRRE